jgi:hypothetical protein
VFLPPPGSWATLVVVMCVAGVMPEAVEGGERHKLGVEILEITVSMVGMVVKVILRPSQEQTKSSVQEAVVVQGMVLRELVQLAQAMLVNPAVPA